MAICGDCIHFDLCEMMYSRIPEIDGCDYFKDRSRFVELPCEVGDTLYMAISDRQIVLSAVVTEININEASLVIKAAEKITYTMLAFIPSNFGSTVFTTKEEAEQALAKQNQPDNTPQ